MVTGPSASKGKKAASVALKSLDPTTPSLWYGRMAPYWQLANDLMGGTLSMRLAKQRRLPRHPSESDASYTRRIESAVLFNVFRMTSDTLAGYPFSEPIALEPDVPAALREMIEDIDMCGTHLDVFARMWFLEALRKGFSHVLVEYPTPQARADGQPRTLADDRREGLRPYWVHIRPEDLYAARAQMIEGKEVITHIRFRSDEVVVSEDGLSEGIRQRVVEREPGRQRAWTYNDQLRRWDPGEWIALTLPDGRPAPVTLVTLYTSREAFMVSRPPLEDLAHINVAHWQSDSDQRNILSVCRFPMLFGTGIDDADGKTLAVGPNQMLTASDHQAKFGYVEHKGAGIEAGERDLSSLERRMASYGMDFLRERPTIYTATGRVLDQAGVFSPLQVMTISARDAIETALLFTALWAGLPEGGSIKLNMEFIPMLVESADLAALELAWQNGIISDETYATELQRRKTLSPDLNVKTEVEGAEQRRKELTKLKNEGKTAPQPPGVTPKPATE